MFTTRTFDENYATHQPCKYGWNTTSPQHEYHHLHSSSTERMPNLVTADFPLHQNVQMTFNKVTFEDETPHMMKHQHQNHYFTPQPHHKKVHFVEQKNFTQIVEPNDGKFIVCEESIDEEADGFIMQKHKKFELAKWDTFKGV